jgi:hypothetical protein
MRIDAVLLDRASDELVRRIGIACGPHQIRGGGASSTSLV